MARQCLRWLLLLALVWASACTTAAPVLCAADGCFDQDDCTQDLCEPTKGCVHTYRTGQPCSDGNICTVQESCGAQGCAGGQPLACDDGNPCTTESCAPATGCSHVSNTASCDDDNVCTTGDTCSAGHCAGAPISCDDQDVCTEDACDVAKGCAHVPVSAATCDDENPCTTDTCIKSKGCNHAPVEGACDDGNGCTSNDTCMGGKCLGGIKNCSDGNPCTVDTCTPAAGCAHAVGPDSTLCEDSDPCTSDEHCTAGECKGSPTLCSDGNPCTADSCDAVQGCVFADTTGNCNDGNLCTVLDTCAGGGCEAGAPLDCDDGNGCTQDSCLPALGCRHIVQAGLPCDDTNACTVNESCSAKGTCIATLGLGCDDGNPCTTDTCTPTSGCGHVPASGPCSDGDACTPSDTCSGGACVAGPTIDCDDGQPCTTDNCWAAQGCVHLPNAATCSDDDPCTVGDACGDGKCVATAQDCTDNNPCTQDNCAAGVGTCLHSGVTGVACNDGNGCTVSDTCTAGVCKGIGASCDDANACTADACDPLKTGNCLHVPIVCNDNRPCTVDTCSAATGCTFVNKAIGVACDDGNACTSGDACTAKGTCGGSAKVCNDGKVCTLDSCSPAQGCVFTATTGSCDDGDACTTQDTCAAGACMGGKPVNCDDGNSCTADACAPKTGCTHLPLAEWTPCDKDFPEMICSAAGYCSLAAFLKLMSIVPAGMGAFGCNAAVDKGCQADESPQHVAEVSGVLLDVYEVSVAQYKACVAAGQCTAPASGPGCNYAVSGRNSHPINCVQHSQAAAYCAWSGKRLPTEHEWEKAARGGCGTLDGPTCLATRPVYPWGNGAPTCNLANFNASGTSGCGTGATWAVGGGFQSDTLQFDLAGNVGEWVADSYAAAAYGSAVGVKDPKHSTATGSHVVRGGGLDSSGAMLRAGRRLGVVSSTASPGIGFRCAHTAGTTAP